MTRQKSTTLNTILFIALLTSTALLVMFAFTQYNNDLKLGSSVVSAASIEFRVPDEVKAHVEEIAKKKQEAEQKAHEADLAASAKVDNVKVAVKDVFNQKIPGKTVYLTFDDGPYPPVTEKLLDILKENNVKATFFIVGKNAVANPATIKREASEGHTIANHSYTHDYTKIYSGVSAFMSEIRQTTDALKKILGTYETRVVRFPGGGQPKSMAPYKAQLDAEGYSYIDWNAMSNDATGLNVPVDTLIAAVKSTTGTQKDVVVLMHDTDTKKTNIEALSKIIKFYRDNGYTFKLLK